MIWVVIEAGVVVAAEVVVAVWFVVAAGVVVAVRSVIAVGPSTGRRWGRISRLHSSGSRIFYKTFILPPLGFCEYCEVAH